MTPQAIYRWVRGATIPRPPAAAAIAQLSRGQLSMQQVYAHREALR